jgi:hypothetical protein
MATLIPCLSQLRRELNAVAPARDTRSDGWIGDPAHRKTVSDHNPDETGRVPIRDADRVDEVHALDADVDLNRPGLTMSRIVAYLAARCRAGVERRLRYIIYARQIWHVDNDWNPVPYDGSNPHTGHAHFSASYDSRHEASTAEWGLEEIPVPMTAEDRAWVASQLDALEARLLANMPPRVWNHTEGNPEDIDPETGRERPGRMGGWARMANKRDNDRHKQVTEALDRIEQALTAAAQGGTPESDTTS